MWSTIFDILADAALDSLMILPFLLVMHIAIEVFEAHAAAKMRVNKALASTHAPFFASSVGLIPQCGFSVVATKLYSDKSIRLGTLLAVYIATSDEAIPVILSTPSAAIKVVPLLILKFVFALIMGYSVNTFLKRRGAKNPPVAEESIDNGLSGADAHSQSHEHTHGHSHTHSDENEDLSIGCHGHKIGTDNDGKVSVKKRFDFERYIYHPLLHSLTVLMFIFAVNLVMGGIIEAVGEDKLYLAMNNISYLQPLLAALIGLIPNCAGSVVIAQMYAVGGLSLGAAFAGLSVNAGIAFAVLFKQNKPFKNNVKIVVLLYSLGVIVGTLITVVMNLAGWSI